jgi:hypothetical protein
MNKSHQIIKQPLPSGACWAFTAVEAIESMYLLKVGGTAMTASLALSPQQVTSCCTSANGCSSLGCSGGYSDDVSDHVGDFSHS